MSATTTTAVVPGDPSLSEAQQRSIAQSNGAINIWSGPIRAGKTVGSLLRWAQYLACDPPTGGVYVVTGKTLDTIARNVFAPLMDPKLLGHDGARLTQWTRGAPTGTIMGKSVEVVSGSDAGAESRVRGMTCAGWYGDELTILPETFLDQLVGRASVPGAKGFGTTNVGAPNHWLRKRYILNAWRRTSGVRHWAFTMEDNPTLTPEYKAMLKALYTGMWYKRMILGLWVMAEGAVFDGFDEDRHVVDELPEPGSITWIGTGTDYGTRNPFACLLLGMHRASGTLYITHEYRWDSKATGRQMSDSEYSAAVTAWLAGIELAPGLAGVTPQWEIIDPSAASYRLQRYQDGATPFPGDNGVSDGIRTMASLFAIDRLKIHRRCAGLIAELPGYSWDDKAAALGRDEPVKADDHSIDGSRYVIQTTRQIWHADVPLDRKAPDAALV